HSLNRDIRKLVPDDASDIKDLDEEVIKLMSHKEEWLDSVNALFGTAKNIGFHAAGVVISNEPLEDLVPLLPSAAENGGLIGIQYDMHDCEVLGLLKLDMLGLRNLDIIQKTLNNIEERHPDVDPIDIYNLPPDDTETFNLISEAKFVSVFQLDSTGYRRLCRQLKPGSFEHIMALNALFRPGPLESGVTAQYVERRHGREPAVSWHPWLDGVLTDTYQTVLFQEQAMAMARIIAGFSDVEADKFRKGIGKKIPEVVEACITDFREGAMKMQGLTPPPGYTGTLEQWIAELTEKLHGYARYMWNRGHCLHSTSQVMTCDRGWVFIKDIKVDEEIWSVREKTGDLFKNRVVNVINNGVREVIEVSEGPNKLICTPDHGFLSSDFNRNPSGYIKAKDMKDVRTLIAYLDDNNQCLDYITIDSVKNTDKCEVWDLTMEQDPNFIANAFVVHNSSGYGWITYITAYLESHYPHEYFIALLDSYNKPSRLAALIRSILSRKICKIVPPNVNESDITYAIGSDNNIYMGLAAIRSVGKSAEEIVNDRAENGKYSSFTQFCQRMPSVNKTAKVNLVKAGAFSWDKMLCDRDKIDNVSVIQKWAKKRTKKYDGSKVSPFEIIMKLEQVEGYDYTEIERNKNEREVLHSFITGHPASVYQNLAQNLERGNTRVIVPSQVKFDKDENSDGCEEGETVLVVGMVDFITRKMTREKVNDQGKVIYPSKPFISVSISDNEGYTITNIWHPLCDNIQKTLIEGEIAMFECVVNKDKFRDDFVSLRVKSAINLAHGLPIQGVFRLNGYNSEEIVQKIGGMVQQTATVGVRNFSSIRGRISVMPDILDKVVKEYGDDVSYLISMDTTSI
ncbi:hypothetical protein KAR91_13125, partial [Candidatus Pacearchaeota archaeon]|nr:hypothetical protein [Candidatus Pacearchaeota archaeon]